jgi:hypothetical protein
MALVTLMSGECRAGLTPQTTRYPISDANANVNAFPMNNGPVILPSARAVPIPAVTIATSREAFWNGVTATASASFATLGAAAGAGGGAGRGAGGRMSPFWVTIAPRTTSSLKSTPNSFSFGAMERRNFVMLFEYKVEDWVGSREGKSV